ncbi:hypothetical protein V3C99_007078 [Haemonchus contortus]
MNQSAVLLLLVIQLVALSSAQYYGPGFDSYGDPIPGFDSGAILRGASGAFMGGIDGIFFG